MAESAGSALTWPDFVILAASLAALVVIGGAFSREQQATEDFFLARRRIPWWAGLPLLPRHGNQRGYDHRGARHRV